MFWLALGSGLLLLAAFGARRWPPDWIAAAALVIFFAASAWSLTVYSPYRASVAVLGGSLAALGLTWATSQPKRPSVRLAALLAGIAAASFALFGPAQGLF